MIAQSVKLDEYEYLRKEKAIGLSSRFLRKKYEKLGQEAEAFCDF